MQLVYFLGETQWLETHAPAEDDLALNIQELLQKNSQLDAMAIDALVTPDEQRAEETLERAQEIERKGITLVALRNNSESINYIRGVAAALESRDSNPYSAHRDLVAASEMALPSPPTQEMGLAFNPDALKEKIQISRISRSEIPPEVSLANWETICTAFRRKVEKEASPNERIAEVRDDPDTSYVTVSSFFDSTFIKNLLNFDEILTIEQAQFASIFYSLLQKSDEPQEDHFFTEREKQLIHLAFNITYCGTGKSESIAFLYYRPEFVTHRLARGTFSENYQENRLSQMIVLLVEEYLMRYLTDDESLVRELAQIDDQYNVLQLSHQSQFLRNLIGQAVGLPLPLKFDLHIGCVYRTLLEYRNKRNEAIEAFYRLVTPQGLITFLQTCIEQKMQEDGNTLFADITHLLPQGNDLWNEECTSLTTQGCISLLKHIGVLTQTKSECG